MVRIRDGEILERKVIGKNEDGEPITADVVASIRDLIVVNDKILNRVLGLPRVEGDLVSDVDQARLFLEFLHALLGYLAETDQTALEHLSIHVEGFAESIKRKALPHRDNGQSWEMK